MNFRMSMALLLAVVLLSGCVSGPKVEVNETRLSPTTSPKIKVGEVYEYEERFNVSGNVTKFRINFTVVGEGEISGKGCLEVSGIATEQKVAVNSCFNNESGRIERISLSSEGKEKEIPKELQWQFSMFFFDPWMLSLKGSSHYQINITKSYSSSFGFFDYVAVNKRVTDITFVRREKFFERDAFRVQRVDRELNIIRDEQSEALLGNQTLLIDEEKRVLLYSRDENGIVEIELINASFKIR